MEDAHHNEPIYTPKDTFIRLMYNNTVLTESVKSAITLLVQQFTMQLSPIKNIPERLSTTLSLINQALPFFHSCFCHVDMMTTIIDYLQMAYNVVTKNKDDKYILPFLFTIFDISNNPGFNYILLYSVIMNTEGAKETFSDYSEIFIRYTTAINYQRHEIIVLEDSDLYSVINYLRRSHHLSYLKRIWVDKVISSKFRWLLDYYQIIWNELSVFQLRQEVVSNIYNIDTTGVITIISIWSKDIIDAKVFASSLNATVVFINAHMNFYGNLILFPYSKLQFKDLQINKWTFHLDDSSVLSHNCADLSSNKPYYNLYYNGTWQKPVNGIYWLHEDKILANAAKNDFIRCMDSAKKGFELWRKASPKFKSCVLFNFAHALKRAGNIGLSRLLVKWVHQSACCKNSLRVLNSSGEVTIINKPKGIMLLHERSNLVLFRKLTLTLLTGNTVIVLITKKTCASVAPYFNMFLMDKMPLGVVNLLSSTMTLEYIKSGFCMISQTSECNLEIELDEIFKRSDTLDETFMNLNIPMFISYPIE